MALKYKVWSLKYDFLKHTVAQVQRRLNFQTEEINV